jgi:phage protein D
MDQSGTAQVRQPRGIVTAGGQRVPFVSFEVDNNSFYQADTFRVELPISALPSGYGADWFASQAKIDIQVFAGFPSDPTTYTTTDLTSLIYGRVDDMDVDWSARLITITGRDLTGQMIDTKTSEQYLNKTSSQVAAILAAKYGLTPVITATTRKIGAYFQLDHVRSHEERTEWDLLNWLAREEGFVAYVQGQELHFEPRGSGTSSFTLTYTPPPADGGPISANATKITTSHSLTLAKDIKVEVSSWHGKQQRRFTATATGTKARNKVTKGSNSSSTPTQVYSYTYPNLDQAGAQAKANQLLAELSQHEFKLSFEGPADVALMPSGKIQLQGTGTAFDQAYYPDSIVRSMTLDDGFKWTVSAKNHDPNSQVNL